MTKPCVLLLLGLSFAAVPACGRKGPLELPPGRAPRPVEDLTAARGDGEVLLRWTNPDRAVSGRPTAPLEAVEVWVFAAGLPPAGRPLQTEEVLRTARMVKRIPRKEFGPSGGTDGGSPGALSFSYAPESGTAPPARLAFTVRVIDRAGRASAFAAPVAVDVPRKDLPGPCAEPERGEKP